MRTNNTWISAAVILSVMACGQEYREKTTEKVERVERPPTETLEQKADNEQAEPVKPDLRVMFILPEEGDTIQGRVTVVADFSPSAKRVDLFLEEQLLGSLGPNDSDSFLFDSTEVSDGDYRMFLIAYGENTVVKARRNITVRNIADSMPASAARGRIFITSPQPGQTLAKDSVSVQVSATSGLAPYYLMAYWDDQLVGKAIQSNALSFSLVEPAPGPHTLNVAAYEIKTDRVLAADEVQVRVALKPAPPPAIKGDDASQDGQTRTPQVEPPKEESIGTPQAVQGGERFTDCTGDFPTSTDVRICFNKCGVSIPGGPVSDLTFLPEPERCGYPADCAYLAWNMGITTDPQTGKTIGFVRGYCTEAPLMESEK